MIDLSNGPFHEMVTTVMATMTGIGTIIYKKSDSADKRSVEALEKASAVHDRLEDINSKQDIILSHLINREP